jgi:hypothetical protein
MSKYLTLTVAFATLAMLAGCSAETDDKQPVDVGASSQAVGAERGVEAPPPGRTDGRGEGDPTATEGSTVEPSTTPPSDGCGEDGRLCPNETPPSDGCGEGGRLCPTPAR